MADASGPFYVKSRDGTEIAYWTRGEGPPLVLVHGTTSNHTTWDPLLPHLEEQVTSYALDRRGRGASSDADDYDATREFEDVAAVVDRAAATSGAPVDLLGHSFGGLVAYGAARTTDRVRRLALYEGWPTPDPSLVAAPREVMDAVADLVERGDHDGALETFYREVVHMPDEQIAAVRGDPAWWKPRVDAAHTIAREDLAVRRSVLDPDEADRLAIPVLLIVGAESPPSLRGEPEAIAAALPDATIEVLEGQRHLAHMVDPGTFADRLLHFLGH